MPARKGKPKGYQTTLLFSTDVPKPMIELARRRTEPMMRRMNMLRYNLQQIVMSAYLQGVEDAVDATK